MHSEHNRIKQRNNRNMAEEPWCLNNTLEILPGPNLKKKSREFKQYFELNQN